MEIILMIYIAGIYLFTKYFLYLVAIVIFWYIVKFIIDKMNKPAPITFETEEFLPGIGLSEVTVQIITKKVNGLDHDFRIYTTKDNQIFRFEKIGHGYWLKYNQETKKWEKVEA